MNARVVLATTVLILTITGCTEDPSPAPTRTKTPEKPAAPVSQVLYKYMGREKFVQFVAEIKNPADQTRFGVETTWKVYDADGVIVGSFKSTRPPIPGHGSILYAGGGGELSGVGEKLTVEITNEGGVRERMPAQNAKVSKATFDRGDFNAWKDARTFEASVVIQALADVDAKEDVNVWVVLRKKNGKVVGTGWSGGPGFEHQGLPEQMTTGDKAKLTIDAAVPSGRPKSVEAFIAEDAAEYDTTRR